MSYPVVVRHECHGITGSPRTEPDSKIYACDFFNCLNHLEDREAAPVAAVKDQTLAPFTQVIEGSEMGTNQISHMDVVAYARSIWGGIVVAKSFQMGFLSSGGLESHFYQMRRAGG